MFLIVVEDAVTMTTATLQDSTEKNSKQWAQAKQRGRESKLHGSIGSIVSGGGGSPYLTLY